MFLQGTGVKVGILDSGFHFGHKTVRGARIAAKYDFVANRANPEGSRKDNYHGTATLSLLAAHAPGTMLGACWNATFYVGRSENINYEKRIEEDFFMHGVEWMEERGVDILSMSLGYKAWYTYTDFTGTKSPISQCCTAASDKGVLVVIANGNEGREGIGAPADAKRVLSVGSVDTALRHSGFSSVGPTADGRLKPELVAMGASVYVADSK